MCNCWVWLCCWVTCGGEVERTQLQAPVDVREEVGGEKGAWERERRWREEGRGEGDKKSCGETFMFGASGARKIHNESVFLDSLASFFMTLPWFSHFFRSSGSFGPFASDTCLNNFDAGFARFSPFVLVSFEMVRATEFFTEKEIRATCFCRHVRAPSGQFTLSLLVFLSCFLTI